MSETLKPCPFCGGGHIEIVNQGSMPDDPHVVQCDDCDASASGMSMGEAIAAWNRRAERTCRVSAPVDGEYRCGECGHLNRETYRADKGWCAPEYCAHCGARVVEGDA